MSLFNLFKKDEKSKILAMAKAISGNDEAVIEEISSCLKDVDTYFEEHIGRFEDRGIEIDESEDEICLIALVDVLIEYGYACECDWNADREEFVFQLNELKEVIENQLPIDVEWFSESTDVVDWCRVLEEKWKTLETGIRAIDIDSDSYVFYVYSSNKFGRKSKAAKHTDKAKDIKPKKATSVTLSRAELNKVIECLNSISVWSGNHKTLFFKEQLDEQMIPKLLEEVMSGKWNKLIMELEFQGEGIYVKRLKKRVQQTWIDTLVIHNSKEGMALIYICRKRNRIYELIYDYHMYSCVDVKMIKDISLGSATLPEYLVHKDKKKMDKGLKFIFRDITSAAERLALTEAWGEEIPAGTNNFNKLCIQFGAVEATESTLS